MVFFLGGEFSELANCPIPHLTMLSLSGVLSDLDFSHVPVDLQLTSAQQVLFFQVIDSR